MTVTQAMKGDNIKLAINMKTQVHPKKLIRAVYPNGSDKRGYHIVLTMQEARRFSIPFWLTKLAGKLTPQTFGSC